MVPSHNAKLQGLGDEAVPLDCMDLPLYREVEHELGQSSPGWKKVWILGHAFGRQGLSFGWKLLHFSLAPPRVQQLHLLCGVHPVWVQFGMCSGGQHRGCNQAWHLRSERGPFGQCTRTLCDQTRTGDREAKPSWWWSISNGKGPVVTMVSRVFGTGSLILWGMRTSLTILWQASSSSSPLLMRSRGITCVKMWHEPPESICHRSWRSPGCAQRFVKRDLGLIPDDQYPKSRELQWRLKSFAMNLTSPDLPKPFRAPYIPGITVLIPHYSESILLCKDDLESKSQSEVPLMSWLTNRYHDEYQAFVARQRAFGWTSSRWQQASAKDWEQLCEWASLRSQTLWRTVERHDALLACAGDSPPYQLQVHCRVFHGCKVQWDVHLHGVYADVRLLQAAPVCTCGAFVAEASTSFQIAFIDYEDKGQDAEADKVHPRQKRRYYSALIDSSCSQSGNRRKPRLRIELPGFPILGDGKGDNQNHALPFSRGSIIQVIDANQGAYFEQMLLLPCAPWWVQEYHRGRAWSPGL